MMQLLSATPSPYARKVRIALAADNDFDLKTVAMQPPAFMALRQVRQPVSCFELKGLSQLYIHDRWFLGPGGRVAGAGMGSCHGARPWRTGSLPAWLRSPPSCPGLTPPWSPVPNRSK